MGFSLPWWGIVIIAVLILFFIIGMIVLAVLGLILLVGIFLAIFLPLRAKAKKKKEEAAE